MLLFSVVAFLGLLLSGSAAAGRESGNPILSILRSDCDATELSLSLDALDSRLIETQEGPFSLLSIADYGHTEEVGHPCLPVIREFIEIPHGADVDLLLLDDLSVEHRLADLGLESRIVPTQEPVPDTPGAREAALFAINREVYASDKFVPGDSVLIAGEIMIRGRRVLILEIRPVGYSPRSGVIRVLESARIRLSFTNADILSTAGALDRYGTPRFDQVIHDVVLNAALFEANLRSDGWGKGPSRATGYLMIADPAFTGNAALLSLKAFRESEGHTVTLVDTGTTGTSTTGIQSYIQNAYNTWNPAPEYILLIGDTNTIPHWVGTGTDTPSTDLYYACVDGSDYFPDVKRGRLPVRTATHLTNLCNKILDTASNTVKKGAFMAGKDYWTLWEQIHDALITEYFDPNGWTSDKLYRQTYGAGTTDVKNAFNDGRSAGCYRGHGSATSWADGPVFSQSNVRALTNTVYPCIWSFSCLTGKYSNSECFGETWVRDDHGSKSFFGASVVSFTTENNKLYRKVIEGWFDQGHVRLGDMIDYGQYELHLVIGGGEAHKRAYYEMYNLMGDPAMETVEPGSGSPHPDIKIDGQDGHLTIPSTQSVTITISLDPGNQPGVPHDWWIFATMNFTQDFWWKFPGSWTHSATPRRAYNGGLIALNNFVIHQGTIPAGLFVFTFAVDTLNNNYEGTWIDTVSVQSN